MRVISAFLKDNLHYIIGSCVVIVLVFLVLQWQRADKYYDKYLVSEGDFQAKNKAYIELKRDTDREKAILARERDEEAQARAERDKEINQIRAAGRKKDKALVEAKAKIKELSPDELTTSLNQRVPDQFTLLGTEDFRLTRYGGEATLGLFMDGERCAEALSERDSEIEKYKNKEKSFNTEISKVQTALTKTETALAGCDKARLAAITSKDNLKKAFDSMKVKQFIKGAGGVALIVVVLKVAKVI